jgi:hypothetical protein
MVSRIGGQTCFHHGTPIENRWYQMQFEQIVEGKGKIALPITNENDDPPY